MSTTIKRPKPSLKKTVEVFGKPNRYSKPLPIPTHLNVPEFKPKYTGYRTGVLNSCYNAISKLAGMEGTTKASFVKECMEDGEINDILSNGYLDRLDDMSGLPKLFLTIYSKYIQHQYIS